MVGRRPNWKLHEREIAKWLGGRRVPVTGRTRGDAPDILHERFSVECKSRKALPALLVGAMDQARKSVRGEQVPIVVLHPAGGRHADDLVVLRLADFAALVGSEGAE